MRFYASKGDKFIQAHKGLFSQCSKHIIDHSMISETFLNPIAMFNDISVWQGNFEADLHYVYSSP